MYKSDRCTLYVLRLGVKSDDKKYAREWCEIVLVKLQEILYAFKHKLMNCFTYMRIRTVHSKVPASGLSGGEYFEI